MKIHIVLCCCLVFLGGCSGLRQMHLGGDWEGQPAARLLTCLNDTESMMREEIDAEIESAEKRLEYGREEDTLRFICLSLNAHAEYEQFKHGTMVLEQYIQDHPESGSDLQGLRILVDRLDDEIKNKWNSWKTLLDDKKALKAEIVSLQARVEELQKQIEQLKKIEEIIKSREIGQ